MAMEKPTLLEKKYFHYYFEIARGVLERTLEIFVLPVVFFCIAACLLQQKCDNWYTFSFTMRCCMVVSRSGRYDDMCQVAGKETSKPCAPPACSDVKVPRTGRWRGAQYVFAHASISWFLVWLFLQIVLNRFLGQSGMFPNFIYDEDIGIFGTCNLVGGWMMLCLELVWWHWVTSLKNGQAVEPCFFRVMILSHVFNHQKSTPYTVHSWWIASQSPPKITQTRRWWFRIRGWLVRYHGSSKGHSWMFGRWKNTSPVGSKNIQTLSVPVSLRTKKIRKKLYQSSSNISPIFELQQVW